MKMSKKQKIKLIIAVICLIASLAIAALSIGGIVSAASASYDGEAAEGSYCVPGALDFVIAIFATMVLCTFTLSAAALLALAPFLLFHRMLTDATKAFQAPDAPDAPNAHGAADAPNAPKVSDSPHGAIKALYVASLALYLAEALGALSLIAMFVVSLI